MKDCGESRLKAANAAPLSGRSGRQQCGEKLAGVGAERQVRGVFLPCTPLA